MMELTTLRPVLYASATVAVAYAVVSIIPFRRPSWITPPLLALAPAAAAVWPFGLGIWYGVVPVAIAWAVATAGLVAFDRIENGAIWIGAQTVAVVAFVGTAFAFPHRIGFGLETSPVLLILTLLTLGLVVAVGWGGEFVGRAIRPYAEGLGSGTNQAKGTEASAGTNVTPTGLPNGGMTIGRWERLLIYLFVLAGSAAAIGFLVTAKSILRFGEISDHDTQKEAEYIIIGTLMSFGFALIASYITRLALLTLLPDTLFAALSLGNGG